MEAAGEKRYDHRSTLELQFCQQTAGRARDYRLLRRSRDKMLRKFERT